MSSIGGINSSSDIMQLLQRLASQQTEEESTALFGCQKSSGSQPGGFESQLSQALKAMGLSDDEIATIQDEIKSAISEAVENAEDTTDPRETIQSAIEQTLQAHGVDTDQLKSRLQPPSGGMPPMEGTPPGNGMPPGMEEALKEMDLDDDEISTIQEEIQAAIDQIEDSSDGTTDVREAIRNAIDETLQNHGVDTDELKSQMQPPQNDLSMMAATGSSQSNERILAQLGYATSIDESSYQWLLSLLPLMDEQA